MPIYDACLEPGIRIVHVRHESAAVFMADACAQVAHTRSVDPRTRCDAPNGSDVAAVCGVALVTAGPGFANAVGGLYSALMAESPVVLISGDSAVTQDGKRAFQELSQTTASAPFVKHAVRVTDVNRLADTWHECVSIATSGRPGPVHIALPVDVLLAAGKSAKSGAGVMQPDTVVHIPDIHLPNLSEVTRALHTAQKPLVLTGPAMTASRMQDRLGRIQQVTGIPVIAMESPRGLADPSLGKLASVINQADCVLLLGKLPDFTLGFASMAKVPAHTVIVVDADETSLQQSVSVLAERQSTSDDDSHDGNLDRGAQRGAQQDKHGIISVHAKPIVIADALCQQYIGSDDHASWFSHTAQLLAARAEVPGHGTDPVSEIAADSESLNDDTSTDVKTTALTPQQIGQLVQESIDDCEKSILVCDGGEFGQWAQACVRSDLRVINGPSGAIGGSLPQAVAAKIANPDCVVFAMLGDGTVGFHLAELETSVREQAPIIVIIGNDSRWNAEYQIQLRDYGADRLHSCELGTNVRYDLAAAGLGCAGAMVQTKNELTDALSDAVQRSRLEGQSTCINVCMVGWPAPVFE